MLHVTYYVSTASPDRPASETVSRTNVDNPDPVIDDVFSQTAQAKSYFELVAARNKALSSKSPPLSPNSTELSPKSADLSWKSSSISPKSVDKSSPWSSASKSPRSAISDSSNTKSTLSKAEKAEKTKLNLTSVSEAVRRDAKFSSGKSSKVDEEERRSPQPLNDSDPEQAITPSRASKVEGTMATTVYTSS